MQFPGQTLIMILEDLRLLLLKDPLDNISLEALLFRLNNSGVERTYGLMTEMGDDCSFFRKSLNIFLDRDYEELSKIIKVIKVKGNLGIYEELINSADNLFNQIG
jgi:hypothetical protein